MGIEDFFVQGELPAELQDESLVKHLGYQCFEHCNPVALSLHRMYPRELATLRYRLGLANLTDAKVLMADNMDVLWSHYLEHGLGGVADFFHINKNTATSYLRGFGFWERRDERLAYRRSLGCMENHPFLQDSHLKYYLLGFILGDGCIQTKWSRGHSYASDVIDYSDVSCYARAALSLALSSSDREYLELFLSVFPHGSIRAAIKGNYILTVLDRGICEWLIGWGITPRKSFHDTKLGEIPEEYFYSFMLGLFDSDGWVAITNRGHTVTMGWCGHHSYMQELYSRLSALYPKVRYKVREFDGLILMQITESATVVSLVNEMYMYAPFFLERKYLKFKQAFGDKVF